MGGIYDINTDFSIYIPPLEGYALKSRFNYLVTHKITVFYYVTKKGVFMNNLIKLLSFITILVLIGVLFLVHGLGFAYLSFLFSICPIVYLIYRLKAQHLQYKCGKKIEILKSCFDVFSYIIVLTMVVISIYPNILFFPTFLKNGNVPNVETYFNYFNNRPFLQGFLLKFPVNIAIEYSFYNVYSHFVFVFNIIYFPAGIQFLILFPVIKTAFSRTTNIAENAFEESPNVIIKYSD
jgi:hypothetical protein